MHKAQSVKLPETFCQNMHELLGAEDYLRYLESYEMPKWNGLRVNTEKITLEDFLMRAPFDLSPIPWTTDGFYYSEQDQPTRHPYFYAGLYYIQEPSAMAPVSTLGVNLGDCCLDLCAAPGGKTLQLSNKAGAEGCVVSNDISASRLKAVVRNIEGFGLKNVIVVCEPVERLCDKMKAAFDVVLVDAPCSGEGMFRKEPSLIRHWDESSNAQYSKKQSEIVARVPELMKTGGLLAYSTCTFSPLENEAVIEQLLERESDFSMVDIPRSDLFQAALQIGGKTTNGAARLYPHKLNGEGHFVALLRKGKSWVQTPAEETITKAPEAFLDFQARYFKEPLTGRFQMHQNKLYLEPATRIDFSGLRVQRSGWYLGDIERERFEPSQAFAMGLKADQFKQVLRFELGDGRISKYLKCESLSGDYEEGFHLVCVEEFPLGFCKVVNKVFKNLYPVGWRLMRDFE